MVIKILGAVLAVSLLTGCCPGLDKDKIKSDLSKDLIVGDSREKIERVLSSHGFSFSYSEYQNLYNTTVRGKNCAFDKAVILTIYLDESGQMLRIETSDSYTFL